MLLPRGLRFAHVTTLAHHIRTLRADPYRLHAGRREHPHVLLGYELTTVLTLGHVYEVSDPHNIVPDLKH